MRDMTENELHAFYDKSTCPNCGQWAFVCGPRGGLSVNVTCQECGLRLNVTDTSGFRIGQVIAEPPGYEQKFGLPSRNLKLSARGWKWIRDVFRCGS